jgi:taurine dioxygenase
MGYETIEVRKVTPVIGAEVHGADLTKPLGNQQFQEIHDALMDNCDFVPVAFHVWQLPKS